ncbi:hypothetical protein ACFLYB_07265 [Chloroflexota bacterium]
MKKFLTLVLSIVMVIGVAVPVSASALSDLCDSFPDGPLTVDFDLDGGYNASYIRAAIAGGSIIADGLYAAWCADLGRSINVSDTFTAMAYCSYDLASLPQGYVDNPDKYDEVNWVLNQDFVGADSPGGFGTYTSGDVEMAIWTLLDDGPIPQNAIDSLTAPYDPDRLNEIVTGANANDGFMPGGGEKLVVVLSPMLGDEVGQTVLITIDIPEEGDEGCTPGFWKNNAKNKDAVAWVGYDPEDDFSGTFVIDEQELRANGKNVFSDPTLLQALNANGSGINLLARAATAALLNASNPNINYPRTEAEIKADVAAAVAAGDEAIQTLGEELDDDNNLGCSINQKGEPILED